MRFDLSSGDLDDAVTEGILSTEQSERLRAFLAARGEPVLTPSEEGVEVVRGFHDVFLTIGAGLMVVGAWVVGLSLAALPVSWVLAEILYRKKGTRLPMIVLAVSFVLAAELTVISLGFKDSDWNPIIPAEGWPAGLWLALAGFAAAIAFGWRFKVPFTALLVAISLGYGALATAQHFSGMDYTSTITAITALVSGLAAFAAAMAFDLSDRDRKTRRSDAAFWLHMAAAPGIVHGLMALIVGMEFRTPEAAGLVFVLIALLALVAVTIDRRSLIVSGLIYLSAAIATLVKASQLAGDAQFSVVFAAVGAAVLAIGLGWHPLRRSLLAVLPPRLTQRLSPL